MTDYIGTRTDTGRTWPLVDIFGRHYNRLLVVEQGVGAGRFVVYPAATARVLVDARLAEIYAYLEAEAAPRRKRKDPVDDETS